MPKISEIRFSHFYKATAEVPLIKTYISSLKENLPKEEDSSSDTLLASYFAYLKGGMNHDAAPPYKNWVHIWEKMDLTSEDEVQAAEKIKKITDDLVEDMGFHNAFVFLSRGFQLAEALRKEGRRDTTPLFSEALENLALENPIEYKSLDLGNLRISEGVLEAYKKTCSKKMIAKIFFGSFAFLTGHFVKFYMNATVSTHSQESSIASISILSNKSIPYNYPEAMQQSSLETSNSSINLFGITIIALPILLGAYWFTKYFTQKLQGSSEDNRLSQIEDLSPIHHSNRKPEHKTTQMIQGHSLQNKPDVSFESKDNDNLGNSPSIIFTDVKNKGSKREKTQLEERQEPNLDDDFSETLPASKIIKIVGLNLKEEVEEHVFSLERRELKNKVVGYWPNLTTHVETDNGGPQSTQRNSFQNKPDASFESKDDDNPSSIIFTDVKNKEGSKREKTQLEEIKDPKLEKIKKSLKKLIPSVRKIRTNKSFIPINDDDFLYAPAASKIIKFAGLNRKEEVKEHVSSIERNALKDKVLAHGPNLTAHGIETGKGGLLNLLNVMLEGLIRTKWWGSLRSGEPSFSAGAHGPHYVIIDGDSLEKDQEDGKCLRINMIDEVYHIAYLVPSPKYRNFIFKVLDKAEEVRMLTKEEVKNLKDKIITYRDFLNFPKTATESITSFKKYLEKQSLTMFISSVRKIRTNKSFIPIHDDDFQETPAISKIIKFAGLNLRKEVKEHVFSLGREILKNKVLSHGANLTAHSIEIDKGGMRTLLNTMLEGLIRTQCGGCLQEKSTHGPYYVIIDGDSLEKDQKDGKCLRINMIDEVYHIAYLVPSPKYRNFIFKVLDKAEEVRMLTKEEVKNLKDKIITYRDFLNFPKKATESITSFKKHLEEQFNKAGHANVLRCEEFLIPKDSEIQGLLEDAQNHPENYYAQSGSQVMITY